uniref:Transmembrane protein n=1 Tax=Angiostrongylus cantonensis TaxID=6313 RepID=A0A0K0D3K6_ANGCA
MRPLSQSWYYWAIVALLIVQVSLSVNYHILICNLPIANTLLLLVIMAHHGYTLGDEARPLFHRICGCVAFIAVLFVNTTHALELLTNYGSDDGHSHSHSGMYVAGISIPLSFGQSWLWQHVDPVIAVISTILFFFLIIPSCELLFPYRPVLKSQVEEMMPYIFAHTPAKFHVESFQNEISATVDKSKQSWSAEAVVRYSEVRQNVTSVLTRAGAQKVVVEPCFLDATEIGRPWVGCVGATCFREDRGCCKVDDKSETQ